jgi:glycosyltransferase involved in cell wall biosynthesis
MAAGRPTVASPVGDVKLIMEQHRLGLLADDSGFAAAISELLANQALCDEVGANARFVAETIFDWKSHVDEVEKFYGSILGQGH